MNLASAPPISFATSRLNIRRYEPTDEDALFEAAKESTREVFEFLPWCRPDYQRVDTQEWLQAIQANWNSAKSFDFAIFDAAESKFHGACGISQIDAHPVGNLGYWLRSSSHKSGIATEAAIAMTRFGIEFLGFKRIEIVMSVKNLASQAVAIRTGAVFEGTLRDRLCLHGSLHDAHLYSTLLPTI